MKLVQIYERPNWMAQIMDQNFLAEDKGLRVYSVMAGEEEYPLAGGEEITFDRAKTICAKLPEGTKVNEYFRYTREREGAPWKGVKDIMHIATYVVDEGGPMSLSEKMDKLNAATPEDVERLRMELGEGYTVGADENGRVWVRKDMRRHIKESLDKNGVSISALAERLGKAYMTTVSAYLLGKCGTTNDTLEEILYLIEDEL